MSTVTFKNFLKGGRAHRMSVVLVALAALCGAGVVRPALAHHSFAMFDKDHKTTLKGTVSKFQWTNPHTALIVRVPNDKGVATTYTFECSSPNLLSHQGWKFNTVKVGDVVTVGFYPLRDGEPGGALVTLQLPDGKIMHGY